MVYAKIEAWASYLPSGIEENIDLATQFPSWEMERLQQKLGIQRRHLAGKNEFTSDLATRAATELFRKVSLNPQEFDYLILVTQSPDFYLPSTSAIVQENLGLSKNCATIDLNQGCSGYVMALGMAKGLIESGQATNILLLTADTYSKFINPADRSVRPIFGDGASATWISSKGSTEHLSRAFAGSDGSGAKHLIVPSGGLRSGVEFSPLSNPERRGTDAHNYDLFMDGREVFNFTLEVSGPFLEQTLTTLQLQMNDIDYFVFHQANEFMLRHLQKKLGIPDYKMPIVLSESGNTVSSTIPIVLEDMDSRGLLKGGSRLLLFGFGVGLSWASMVVTIS